MGFWETSVDYLQEADLQSLVDDAVREDDRLEYKRDMYPSADNRSEMPRLGGDKKELLRDIISLANHRGGRLLIGVDEATDDGRAAALAGVPKGVPPAHREEWDTWIQKQCLSNIDERIVGLRVAAVPLQRGSEIVVVEIPESPGQPHMLTLDKLNQCWKRQGREKHVMSIDEIRESVERSLTNRGRIERYLDHRKRELLRALAGRPAAVMWALPAYFQEEDDRIDLGPASTARRLMIAPPTPAYTKPPARPLPISVGMPGPYRTLEGLRAERGSFPPEAERTPRSLEVHRDGYVEFVDVLDQWGRDSRYALSPREAWNLISFVTMVASLYAAVLPGSPVLLGMMVLNSEGTILHAGWADDTRLTDRPELNLGSRRFDSLDPEDQSVIQWFMDRLWQAFGLEGAGVFDSAGQLIVH